MVYYDPYKFWVVFHPLYNLQQQNGAHLILTLTHQRSTEKKNGSPVKSLPIFSVCKCISIALTWAGMGCLRLKNPENSELGTA